MKNVVNNLREKWKILYKLAICVSIIFISSKVTVFALTSMAATNSYTEDVFYTENTIEIAKEPEIKIAKENPEKILLKQEILIEEFTEEEIIIAKANLILEEKVIPETDETIVSDTHYIFTNEESNIYEGREEVIHMVYQNVPEYRMELDDETYEVLLRVVEAEVTGTTYTYNGEKVSEDEMLLSKIRVAQVFMNRVDDSVKFPNITNLYDALTQKGASSTFGDGRYYTVTVCDLTREAVELALLESTPDYTDGALFFNSCSKKIPYGDYLFTDNVGHHFFK